MNIVNQLETFQSSFCLNDCDHLGGLVWKIDWELTLGIIVGRGPDGTLYVINNQPSLRNYTLKPIDTFHNQYCFYDLENPNIDREAMALLAFNLLHQYNEFNGAIYLKDHKIEFPKVQTIETLASAQAKTQVFSPKLLVPQKINEIAAPIFSTTQIITKRLVHLFQGLFPQNNVPVATDMPTALIRNITPRFTDKSNERTA